MIRKLEKILLKAGKMILSFQKKKNYKFVWVGKKVQCTVDKIISEYIKKQINLNFGDMGLEISIESNDQEGSAIAYDDILHKNGNLVDVIIHDKDMEEFLEIHKKEFDELSLEYIKKINRHKESDSIR